MSIRPVVALLVIAVSLAGCLGGNVNETGDDQPKPEWIELWLKITNNLDEDISGESRVVIHDEFVSRSDDNGQLMFPKAGEYLIYIYPKPLLPGFYEFSAWYDYGCEWTEESRGEFHDPISIAELSIDQDEVRC